MFTMKRCSLIRGVRYERFHCTVPLIVKLNVGTTCSGLCPLSNFSYNNFVGPHVFV